MPPGKGNKEKKELDLCSDLTRGELKEILYQTVEALLDKKLAEHNNELLQVIDGKLELQKTYLKNHTEELCDKIESKVYDCQKGQDELTTRMVTAEEHIADLIGTQKLLQREIMDARESVNDLEQHGRRWAVRIHGLTAPAQSWDEHSKAVAVEFFNKKLNFQVTENDIDCAHRVGKKKDGKQQLLVKFFRRDHAEKLYVLRKKLKGTGYSIFDDSTFENRKLLKKLYDHPEIENSWLIRGKVWAKPKRGSKFPVNLFDDVVMKLNEAQVTEN
jgi:hypothetical protein